jgi:hypothetical protein
MYVHHRCVEERARWAPCQLLPSSRIRSPGDTCTKNKSNSSRKKCRRCKQWWDGQDEHVLKALESVSILHNIAKAKALRLSVPTFHGHERDLEGGHHSTMHGRKTSKESSSMKDLTVVKFVGVLPWYAKLSVAPKESCKEKFIAPQTRQKSLLSHKLERIFPPCRDQEA